MDERKLEDLVWVGQAIRRDFELLGIHTVAELAKHEPDDLYHQLCRKTGTRQDPCVLDTFRAAVAQAREPKLPLEQCRWWYWSRVRKASMKDKREKVSQ
jgi:nucleotidyltransferase/DNA polymerase involved in DNA repair